MVATKKRTAKKTAVKKTAKRLRMADNGEPEPIHSVLIPELKQAEFHLWLLGDRPLMVNNKLNVAVTIAELYGGPGGKSSSVKPVPRTVEQQYADAFYVMPDSKYPAPHPKGRYGVPASGIKKCACSAIRTTGITDNTTIGLIGKSFWVMEDGGGFCLIEGKFTHDVRAVNIGSGAKTVPAMRHRPIWNDWQMKLRIKYNAKVLSPEQIVNLFMHAGQYIGLCELRAEKKQGACGGFVVKGS